MNKLLFSPKALATLVLLTTSQSINALEFAPAYSLILDGHYKSAKSALSEVDKGFGLGHVELSLSSPIDDLFFGKFTGVVHNHDDKTEFEAEEAFIETLSLPGGFSIRAGRFLSDIGYLNSQHTHTDAFTERPAVYRALLGSHYYDDGLRLSYLMPTDLYWHIGTEALRGKKMQADNISRPESVGVYTLFSKWGGDFNEEHSWQFGLNYLRNQNGSSNVGVEHYHDHEHGHHHDHGHDHHHCHKAAYTGKDIYSAEAVWKWAPNGNYKYQNLSLSAEYLQATNITDEKRIRHNNKHDGWYLSSVYQFTPQWSAGVRYGEFNGTKLESDHFYENSLKETELMLSWSHSHFSTVRLQWTQQHGEGFEHINNNIITLQYIMSLGTHDAHQF